MKRWIVFGVLAAILGSGSLMAGQQDRVPTPGQPNVAQPPDVPATELNLGSIRIPRSVKVGGQTLAPGSYQIRVTAEMAKPDATGLTEPLYRWAEFRQGGQVRGREVVTIVPDAEARLVVKDAPPPAGGSKVQVLRGNDYVRVWFNRGGTHYLLHLPAA